MLSLPFLRRGETHANFLFSYRSEGFALTGYVGPGCVEDGAWMLWEKTSVVVAFVVAHPDLGNEHYRFSL